jgi:hypothetical protein
MMIGSKEEEMNALLNKKREWEQENHQQLLRLVEKSQVMTVTSLDRFLQLMSFLLYVLYGTLKFIIIVIRSALGAAHMIQHVGPEHRPLERHEITAEKLKGEFRNSIR